MAVRGREEWGYLTGQHLGVQPPPVVTGRGAWWGEDGTEGVEGTLRESRGMEMVDF